MKPRGMLMIEHRLIEKVIGLAARELEVIKRSRSVNALNIDKMVDFIRTYADRTHHGKEEDILFKKLEDKKLNSEDRKIMQDLINDHAASRKATGELSDANSRYMRGHSHMIDLVIEKLSFLVALYPGHIKKEDKVFFPNTEKYFTAEELNSMLKDFREFDAGMIHEKYNALVKSISAR